MMRDQLIATRQTLVSGLPVSGEILRGSLLERTAVVAQPAAHFLDLFAAQAELTNRTADEGRRAFHVGKMLSRW
jgi:hypothetical protein